MARKNMSGEIEAIESAGSTIIDDAATKRRRHGTAFLVSLFEDDDSGNTSLNVDCKAK